MYVYNCSPVAEAECAGQEQEVCSRRRWPAGREASDEWVVCGVITVVLGFKASFVE